MPALHENAYTQFSAIHTLHTLGPLTLSLILSLSWLLVPNSGIVGSSGENHFRICPTEWFEDILDHKLKFVAESKRPSRWERTGEHRFALRDTFI